MILRTTTLLLLAVLSHHGIAAKPVGERMPIEAEMMDEIPTVTFCDLVKNSANYFGKTVRLSATLIQQEEGVVLGDDECDKLGIGPYSHEKERLGVGFGGAGKEEINLYQETRRKIADFEDSRAAVVVVGILRDIALHGFVWYDRRFDILRFESAKPETLRYHGFLEEGRFE